MWNKKIQNLTAYVGYGLMFHSYLCIETQMTYIVGIDFIDKNIVLSVVGAVNLVILYDNNKNQIVDEKKLIFAGKKTKFCFKKSKFCSNCAEITNVGYFC